MKENGVAVIGGAGFVGTRLTNVLIPATGITLFVTSIRQIALIILCIWMWKARSLSRLRGLLRLSTWRGARDDVRPLSRYDDVNVRVRKRSVMQPANWASTVCCYLRLCSCNTGEDGEPNYFNDYGRTKYLAEGLQSLRAEDPTEPWLLPANGYLW